MYQAEAEAPHDGPGQEVPEADVPGRVVRGSRQDGYQDLAGGRDDGDAPLSEPPVDGLVEERGGEVAHGGEEGDACGGDHESQKEEGEACGEEFGRRVWRSGVAGVVVVGVVRLGRGELVVFACWAG